MIPVCIEFSKIFISITITYIISLGFEPEMYQINNINVTQHNNINNNNNNH